MYETTATLYEHCVVQHKCNGEEMINNMELHIMKFVAMGMSMLDLFTAKKGKNWDSPSDFGITMYEIGQDLGDFIVALFDI